MVPPSTELLPSAAPSSVHHFVATPEKTPRLAVREVIRQAHASGSIAKEVTLAPSTVYRLLRQQGLMDRLGDQAPPSFPRPPPGTPPWCHPLRSCCPLLHPQVSTTS